MTPPEPYVLREPVFVDGLAARTTNADEALPARAKIPSLWHRFYEEGHSAAVEGPVNGVYNEYATDSRCGRLANGVEYFARPGAPQRAYTTDFELYDPSNLYEVRICIAVTSP